MPIYAHFGQVVHYRHGQGLAVLMASAVVVLNMKLQPFAKVTILYQLILHLAWVIMLGSWVTSPAKFGSDPMSGRHHDVGQYMRVL